MFHALISVSSTKLWSFDNREASQLAQMAFIFPRFTSDVSTREWTRVCGEFTLVFGSKRNFYVSFVPLLRRSLKATCTLPQFLPVVIWGEILDANFVGAAKLDLRILDCYLSRNQLLQMTKSVKHCLFLPVFVVSCGASADDRMGNWEVAWRCHMGQKWRGSREI